MTKLALNDRLRKKLYDLLYNVYVDDPYAEGRVLNLDWSTGQDYSALSITSTSAHSAGVGLLVITDTGVEGKPAGYPGGLIGARVSSGAPAWTASGGAALSGVTWRGPLPAATFKAVQSDFASGWANGGYLSGSAEAPTTISGFTARRITGGSGDYPTYYRDVSALGVKSANALIRKVSQRYVCMDFYIVDGSWRYAIVDLNTGTITDVGAGVTASCVPVADSFLVHIEYSGASTPQYLEFTFVGGPTGTPSNINATGLEFDIAVPTVATSVGVRELCVTNGSDITRLAETVAFPQAIGTDWTAVMGVNLSGGIISPYRSLMHATANLGFYMLSNGKVVALATSQTTSGNAPTATTSTVKVGTRKAGNIWTTKADSTLGTPSDLGAAESNTSVKIGGSSDGWDAINCPVITVKIWNRALTDGLFTDA